MSVLVRVYIRLFVLAFLFAGLAMLFVGTGAAIQNWYFVRHAATANGTVTGNDLVRDQDQSLSYRPVFAFKTSDGVAHTVQSETGSNPPSYAVGQQVSVVFDPRTPDDAKINSIGQLWFFPILVLSIGTVGFLCGFFGSKLMARRTRQPMRTGLRADFATIRNAIRSFGFQ